MSEKQAGVVGRWRSRAEVDRLVAEFEASGLTRQEFCTKHGLSLVTLDRYRKRRQQRGEKFAGDSGFLQRATQPAEVTVLGWQWPLGLREAIGEGALPLAAGGRRASESPAQPGRAGIAVGRHRSAADAAQVMASGKPRRGKKTA